MKDDCGPTVGNQQVEAATPKSAACQQLPATLAGHWTTPAGLDMAREYAGLDRSSPNIGMCHLTDFELANAVFMCGRNALGLIAFQTAAKERIRWLSVQLALATARGQ